MALSIRLHMKVHAELNSRCFHSVGTYQLYVVSQVLGVILPSMVWQCSGSHTIMTSQVYGILLLV